MRQEYCSATYSASTVEIATTVCFFAVDSAGPPTNCKEQHRQCRNHSRGHLRGQNPRAPSVCLRRRRPLTSIGIGIAYREDADVGDKLTAYVDSDHAGDLDYGYSTAGVVLYFAGGPVEWTSKKQTVVAISTVEAEYVALSKGCVMVIRNLLESMNPKRQATVAFEGKTGAVSLSRSVKITPRTKHIDVKLHHLRSLVGKEW